ncbi:MAG TPA: PRC-barrel domain-containing protein [Gammaproteobacteria bacterium]|jgi:hypothetical protein
MTSKGRLAIWAGSALLTWGMLAGCDTGNQQEPAAPASESESGDNLAMYEPGDKANDQTGTADDTYGNPPATGSPSTANEPGAAQDDSMQDDSMMGAEGSQQPGMGAGATLESMATDQIVGKTVVSRQGEEIGEVNDVVTDPTSGQKFAVVDVGGFLGVGEKSIVIGLDELQMSTTGGGDRLQSDLTREELQTKTEYAPDDYESLTDKGGQDMTQ